MTHLTIVSVFDSAAEAYSSPIFTASKGVALRSFMDGIQDNKTSLNQHPEHFSLFFLGTFNTDNAKFDLVASPQLLANAWEMQPRSSGGQAG